MKQSIVLVLLSFFSLEYHNAFGQSVLLSYIEQDSFQTLDNDRYPVQLARFDLDRPATLQGLRVHLEGTKGSQVGMTIYGHEGGIGIPEVFEDLIKPITITKLIDGIEIIDIFLKKEIQFDNNQIFISFNNFKGDLHILETSNTFEPSCTSSSGGSFYKTIVLDEKNRWFRKSTALYVELRLEYDSSINVKLIDKTASLNIDPYLSAQSVAWGDLDNDGWEEVLVKGRLLTYNKKDAFVDLTEAFQLYDKRLNFKGNAFIDIDQDQDLDILMFGGNISNLFINHNGYFEKKKLNLPRLGSLSGFSIGDVNGDQLPDLFISQLWQGYPLPKPNFLLINDGNYQFEDQSIRLYPEHDGKLNFPNGDVCDLNNVMTHKPNQNQNRRSRGCQMVDYDMDGDLDIYVANYFLEEDEFYENDGQANFVNVAQVKAMDVNNTGYNHSTSLDWQDYDNDGDLDLLISRLAHPRNRNIYDHRGTELFENVNGEFLNRTATSGFEFEETHSSASWGDVNNDGLADVVFSSFYDCRFNDLYLQQEDHSFQMASYEYGMHQWINDKDASWVDFNNDGLLDLSSSYQGDFRLLENVDSTNTNSWVKLRIPSHTRGTIKVHCANNSYTQQVSLGDGQMMQEPSSYHFGLGDASDIDSVQVNFSDGTEVKYYNIQTGQNYLLHPDGQVESYNLSDQYSALCIIYEDFMNEQLKVMHNIEEQKVVFQIFNSKGQVVYTENNIPNNRDIIIASYLKDKLTYRFEVDGVLIKDGHLNLIHTE